jgi:ATP synthase protein I
MDDEDGVFARQVASKSVRKLRALRGANQGIWSGLGVSGLIGWSVAVPTILGGMLGMWWDRRHPGGRSLTLMLLVAGLVVGCANAWRWISAQDRAMNDLEDDRDA